MVYSNWWLIGRFLCCIGAKLLALKEQLSAQMKVKRDEALQRRVEIYQLDNEEMYEDGEKEELDEGEMTDGSDTDVEDDEFDEQFGNEEFEDENEEPVRLHTYMLSLAILQFRFTLLKLNLIHGNVHFHFRKKQ